MNGEGYAASAVGKESQKSSSLRTTWFAQDDHAHTLVITESRWRWKALTQYLYFPLFWCCVHGMEADSFREGGGTFSVCVWLVCWLAFQIMKCSREQRAGGPYSLCCGFIFTPVSLWFFHTLFLVYLCACVCVCLRHCFVYQCPPPPPLSIL